MGKATSGAGGKTPWSKIANKKGGKSPADGFTKGKFTKGAKSSSRTGGKKGGRGK